MYKDELYAFSFNPVEQPSFQRFYNMKLNNMRDWSERMKENLQLKYAEVDVVLEISSKSRLHYHGYILVKDIVKFIIHDLSKLREYGTYSIKQIEDDEIWKEYVYKQLRFMKEYAEQNDMTYNIKTEPKQLKLK